METEKKTAAGSSGPETSTRPTANATLALNVGWAGTLLGNLSPLSPEAAQNVFDASTREER